MGGFSGVWVMRCSVGGAVLEVMDEVVNVIMSQVMDEVMSVIKLQLSDKTGLSKAGCDEVTR